MSKHQTFGDVYTSLEEMLHVIKHLTFIRDKKGKLATNILSTLFISKCTHFPMMN